MVTIYNFAGNHANLDNRENQGQKKIREGGSEVGNIDIGFKKVRLVE